MTRSPIHKSPAARFEAANAEVKRIEAELSTQDRTAAIELAEAKLASAELDLSHTQIVAQTEGVVTNLQLQSGSYITQGTASLMLVDEAHAWISADFNEKGIDKLTNGREVLVSFDALPGKVFTGEVSSQERAIYDTNNANGQLSSVTNDTRWIREQQKVRTRITVNELDPSMISGSRASVRSLKAAIQSWMSLARLGFTWWRCSATSTKR